MPRCLHHAALCVRDADASLRFYLEALRLEVLLDHTFHGAWETLFDAPSSTLRSVFLGDPATPDAGIVELVVFDATIDDGARPGPPTSGFFLLSFFVDVEPTLERLHRLGLGGTPRRIDQPGPAGPVSMATVVDPDGVLVELIESSATGA